MANATFWYIVIRITIMLALWSVALKYISAQEYSNAHIDWEHYLALPKPVKASSQVAAAVVWLAQVAWLIELAVRWQELFLWPVAAMLAGGIAFCIFGFYAYYADTINKCRKACLLRAQGRLDRLKARREHEREIGLFSRRYNVDLSSDPYFRKNDSSQVEHGSDGGCEKH